MAIQISSLNSLLSCRLCAGYLIDATVIVDCQHACERFFIS